MSDPVQPRQTTRVMAAVQAAQPAHSGETTGPRYAGGSILLGIAVSIYGFHIVQHPTIALERFDQIVIGFFGIAGFGVLPLSEWAVRFVVGLATAYKGYKNSQPPGQ